MRHFLLVIALISLIHPAFSQRPISDIKRLPGGTSVTIDGVVDDFWQHVEARPLSKNFVNESPVFNTTPTWRAMWDDQALYVLVEVDDDEWAPSWITNQASYLSDKTELYFDVNAVLHNGDGASLNANGHYQVGPNYLQYNTGQMISNFTFGASYAFEFGNTYDQAGKVVMEYKIPFSSLMDDGGAALDPTQRTTVGFDVVVIDETPSLTGRQRKVWSNDGAADYDNNGNTGENWNTLDDAGEITFINEEVETGPSSEKQILSFSIDGSQANVDGQNVTVALPYGTDLTSLVAEFTLSQGATAEVGGVVQESGVTANDFSNPLTYTIVAEDGSSADYQVQVIYTRWDGGYPALTGGTRSLRMEVALSEPGTLYYMISETRQDHLTASEIYTMVKQGNAAGTIQVDSISLESAYQDSALILEGLFNESSTYFVHFTMQTNEVDVENAPVSIHSFQTQAYETVLPAGSANTPQGLLQYVPDAYYTRPGEKMPVLIFFHGLGFEGDGSYSELVNKVKISIPQGVKDITHPHLLFVPQCVSNWWVAGNIEQTVDHILDNFNIDTNRLYITGLSMGGSAVTQALDRFPEKIAAAVPVAAAGILENPLSEVPVWSLHNKFDPVVPIEHTYLITDTILAAGGTTILSTPPSLSHDAWNNTYNNQRVWDWLFAQQKDEAYHQASVLTASEIPDPVTLDGQLQEENWKLDQAILFGTDTLACFDVLWSEQEKIYLGVEVRDDHKVSQEDAIRLFIDKDFQIGSVSGEDRIFTFPYQSSEATEAGSNLDGLDFAWSDTDQGYVLEAELSILNYAEPAVVKGFTKGHTIGFDLGVRDEPVVGEAETLYWNGEGYKDYSTESYGTLALINRFSADDQNRKAIIQHTSVAPSIDGAKEALWVDENKLSNPWVFIEGRPDADYQANAHALWDENYLYLWVDITDPVMINSSNNGIIHKNDHVSLLMDMDQVTGTFDQSLYSFFDENDYHFTFLRNSSNYQVHSYPNRDDSGLMASMQHQTRERDNGWSLEVKIPFEHLDASFNPARDAPMGLDVVVGDNDDYNASACQYKARLGSRLERNPQFIGGATGTYWADPVSWLDVKFGKPGEGIYSYSIDGYSGRIEADTIWINVPEHKELTSMKAEFTIPEGAQLMVGDVVQQSGVTENDFSLPLHYTLHLADGSTMEYVVMVTQQLQHDQITVDNPGGIEAYRDSIIIYASPRLAFYKKVPYETTLSGMYHFKLYSDVTRFEGNKPLNVPDFETSYIKNDSIHLVVPETSAQTEQFSNFRQVVVNALAKRVIAEEFSGNISRWLLYGFGRLEAGLLPSPDAVRSQHTAAGRMPSITELQQENLPQEFNFYDFSATAAHFMVFKFGYMSLRPELIIFNAGGVDFNFWSIKDPETYDQVWTTFADLFYLDPDNVVSIRKQSEHFNIWNAPSDDSYTNTLNDNAEEAFTGFLDSLDMQIPHTLDLVVYPSLCSYHHSVGVEECNPNSIGGGVGISIFQMVTPGDLERSLDQMIWLMKHELAHVVQFNIKPRFMPAWLSEGFATFMPTGPIQGDLMDQMRPQLLNHLDELANSADGLPDYDQIGDYEYTRTHNINYYLIGQVMVDWLVKKQGYLDLKPFIRSLGQDVGIYGYDSKQAFMDAFYNWVETAWKATPPPDRPVSEIKKLPGSLIPDIDGSIDPLWDEIVARDINKKFAGENPVFNSLPTWKAVWNNEALFILVEMDDDDWAPSWVTGDAPYKSDKTELYFDVNPILHDGGGAELGKDGHYQVAPNYSQHEAGTTIAGETFGASGHSFEYANTYDGNGNSVMEYKIPFASLVDNTGAGIDPTSRPTIGFDVVIRDEDLSNSGHQRMVWSNDGQADYGSTGSVGENWVNLNDVGEVSFVNTTFSVSTSVPGLETRFVIYPNPSDGLLTVSGLEESQASLLIYSLDGRMVYSKRAVQEPTVHMDLTGLPAGFYILKIIQYNVVHTRKINLF